MREYDKAVDNSSQSAVLAFMDKHRDTWFNTKQLKDELNIRTREKVALYLRKLIKFGFVERKRTNGTNVLLYKIKGEWK
jgi:predicted transcriptional regulator